MGVAIPSQHPPVVLRSQFNKLRALLAVALIAVAGLTVAVVILANDSDKVSSTSSAAKPLGSLNYGDSQYVNPSTGYPSADLQPQPSGRYEGGPVSRYEAEGKYFSVPSAGPASEAKHEAATAAAIGQSSGAIELRGSKASQRGTSAVPVRHSLDAARQTSRKDRANHRPSPFGAAVCGAYSRASTTHRPSHPAHGRCRSRRAPALLHSLPTR